MGPNSNLWRWESDQKYETQDRESVVIYIIVNWKKSSKSALLHKWAEKRPNTKIERWARGPIHKIRSGESILMAYVRFQKKSKTPSTLGPKNSELEEVEEVDYGADWHSWYWEDTLTKMKRKDPPDVLQSNGENQALIFHLSKEPNVNHRSKI